MFGKEVKKHTKRKTNLYSSGSQEFVDLFIQQTLLHTDPMEDIDILKIGGFYTPVVNNHNSVGRIQHIKVVCRLLWDFRRRREGNSVRTGQSGLASQRRWHPS